MVVMDVDPLCRPPNSPTVSTLRQWRETGLHGLVVRDPTRISPEILDALGRSSSELGLALGIALDPDRPSSMPDRSPRLRLVFEGLSRSHPGLFALCTIPLDFDQEAFDHRIDDGLQPFLSRLGVPFCVLSSDPLGPPGTLLRGSGFLADMTGTDLDPDLETPSGRLAPLLAARLPDRPLCVRIAPGKGLDRRRSDLALATALGGGAALIQLPWNPDPDFLKRCCAPFRELPPQWPDRRPEEAAVLCREFPGGIPHGAPPRALHGALDLCHRAARIEAGLRPETRPAAHKAQSFLWIPAHGPLPNNIWNLAWSQARRGATVLITGLCIDETLDRKRISLLGIPEVAVRGALRGELPPWLRENKVLATGPNGLELPMELGRLVFRHRCPECEPEDEESETLIRRLCRTAGLEVPETGSGSPGFLYPRSLDTGEGRLELDLERGVWREIPA